MFIRVGDGRVGFVLGELAGRELLVELVKEVEEQAELVRVLRDDCACAVHVDVVLRQSVVDDVDGVLLDAPVD